MVHNITVQEEAHFYIASAAGSHAFIKTINGNWKKVQDSVMYKDHAIGDTYIVERDDPPIRTSMKNNR